VYDILTGTGSAHLPTAAAASLKWCQIANQTAGRYLC
jgi:hypothetical protein